MAMITAARRGLVRDDAAVFAALREVFQPFASRLQVIADTAKEYTLVTTISPSNKGKAMYFGSVRSGRADGVTGAQTTDAG